MGPRIREDNGWGMGVMAASFLDSAVLRSE